jgi:N-acetylglucosaminyldiphosphoundecaprenol N-acetyl-beta-D-mannosaminyltransferase
MCEHLIMDIQIDDLTREVYCVLGIPVDNVGMAEAVERLDAAISTKTPFLLSTPNINFIVNAMRDNDFRDTLVFSDLCLPDGMWLVRLAKLMGVPVRDRVAGADVLEALKTRRTGDNPLKVFFFGGSDAAGHGASAAINAREDGLHCAGSLNPGFGSIEEMSAEPVLSAVNAGRADFLLVALGAKKGQAWLHRNHAKLTASVRAHLGATVNFYAGAIKRAPSRWQAWGFEWAWRIKEEPMLWRRYAYDGLFVARIFLNRILPLAVWSLYLQWRKRLVGERLALEVAANRGRREISLGGDLTSGNVDKIAATLRSAISESDDIVLNLAGVRAVDARFVGLLYMLQKTLAKRGRTPHIEGAPFPIRWLVALYGFELTVGARQTQPVAASSVEVAAAG